MFKPSRACTTNTSFSDFAVALAAVEYTCSRVSYSATLSTSGVTKCTPGYNVPRRAPQIWLTRTPAEPSGITTMLNANKMGSTPEIASRWAKRQRTGPKGRAVIPVSAPASPVLLRARSRRSCSEMNMS